MKYAHLAPKHLSQGIIVLERKNVTQVRRLGTQVKIEVSKKME